MMRRRTFLGATAAGIAGMVAPAFAAQDKPFRIYRVTYRGRTEVEDGFDDYLASNGIAVEFIERDADRGAAKLSGFVEEIRDLKPDLVYTWGTPVTLGIAGRYDAEDKQNFITDIPIVFALVAAPLNAKLVADRAVPGRNLTGAVHVVPTDTQLRAMHSYRPIERLGVLYSSTEQNSLSIVGELQALREPMGFSLVERQFRLGADGRPSPDGIEELVGEIAGDGANWLYLLPDTFLGTQYDRVTPAAMAARLPTFGAAELAIRQGGALVALISRYYSVGQLAASKAAKILRKEVPVEQIPIETLKRFSLIINMPVAKKLDLYPPIEMLNYAEVLTG
ncbi:ABC transporter substrate-binding protein [Mesorhizobium ephedrae]|jgi:putative ABC transport system substrate-binding protein|uniref:ABC transporter substrate-binding protein n=2 Tax=Kumtagia ephedrae TaxID=2116701 RepID=A0A2P7S5F5_9HYPH|nr:ABC transporter substrate-binding protein [Mesorhizobium ephedrae]